MWSVGGFVLLEVCVCAAIVAWAARRLAHEIEPTVQSFERLRTELSPAAGAIVRDGGRARASARVLVRGGSTPEPR